VQRCKRFNTTRKKGVKGGLWAFSNNDVLRIQMGGERNGGSNQYSIIPLILILLG
jgi:hypothetical protein